MKTLSEREARHLATQIVKDASDVRVKFGKTNGRIALHVYVPGTSVSRTIYNEAGWESHPANTKAARSRNEERENANN